MATANKTARIVVATTTNTAGASTVSSPWNLATALGAVIHARVTNGSTGPTVGCDVLVQTSVDLTNWRDLMRFSAGIAANNSYDFHAEIPAPILAARVVFSGNTAQAVSVEASGHELTSIG